MKAQNDGHHTVRGHNIKEKESDTSPIFVDLVYNCPSKSNHKNV